MPSIFVSPLISIFSFTKILLIVKFPSIFVSPLISTAELLPVPLISTVPLDTLIAETSSVPIESIFPLIVKLEFISTSPLNTDVEEMAKELDII